MTTSPFIFTNGLAKVGGNLGLRGHRKSTRPDHIAPVLSPASNPESRSEEGDKVINSSGPVEPVSTTEVLAPDGVGANKVQPVVVLAAVSDEGVLVVVVVLDEDGSVRDNQVVGGLAGEVEKGSDLLQITAGEGQTSCNAKETAEAREALEVSGELEVEQGEDCNAGTLAEARDDNSMVSTPQGLGLSVDDGSKTHNGNAKALGLKMLVGSRFISKPDREPPVGARGSGKDPANGGKLLSQSLTTRTGESAETLSTETGRLVFAVEEDDSVGVLAWVGGVEADRGDLRTHDDGCWCCWHLEK